jgi:hypothetical protein
MVPNSYVKASQLTLESPGTIDGMVNWYWDGARLHYLPPVPVRIAGYTSL